MKSIIGMTLVAVMAVTPVGVKANELCEGVAELAENVMKAHQNGVPLVKVMRAVTGSSHSPESIELARQVIVNAYDQPRYTTDAYKTRSVSQFRDEWHVACLKSFM